MKYDSSKDTLIHKKNIDMVFRVLLDELAKRNETHDDSKLVPPEKPAYDKYIPMLQKTEYGSLEYYEVKKEMAKECLNHHFEANRHHPEHWPDGDISHMTLVDLVEMFADHLAASMVSSSSYEKGETINKDRYGYSDQIYQIFMNTYNEYFK